MTVRTITAAICLSATIVSAPVLAQSSDPAWLDDLRDQLLFEKQCTIAYVMNLEEGQLGGRLTYEARIQCEDGRMFDANRTGSSGMFTFKACEVQVC
ncbi:MAG: hypothetical protein VYD64_03065 [Pseudomonadota bacterium]|nr:hypothetical protein [Pseudomonadota bacterium]